MFCFPRFVSYTRIPTCASTRNIQGKNRVRESRPHGSVRGVSSNRHPYRDRFRLSSILTRRNAVIAVVALCVLVLCIPVLYAANDYRLTRKYESALARIQIGDSEQSVVALMGQPDERTWCYPLRHDDDSAKQRQFHDECMQQYSYDVFLQSYTVSFDKNNLLSGKYVSVSA